MRRIPALAYFFPPALAALLLAGCGDNQIVVYRVAKDASAPPAPALSAMTAPKPGEAAAPRPETPAAMGDTAVVTASGAPLTWTAPSTWQVKPGNAMRKGSYVLAGDGAVVAELAITAFPGDVGGEIANVNRWRGQLQLAPLPEAEVSAQVTRLVANGLAMTIVDFANPSPAPGQRIVGAMIPHGDATWFFKLMGADALVGKEKPAFLEFLKTVKPAAAASTP